MIDTFCILIGSIGDDSHSVGTSLLTIALREAGFWVKNLGIMNTLDHFFAPAADVDAILISCMNGHADLYLEDFPIKLKNFKAKHNASKVWCLGGNLSVKETAEIIVNKYRRMGFDFVSPKPISVEYILHRLYKEFYRKGIKKRKVAQLTPLKSFHFPDLDNDNNVDDTPMSDREFLAARESILDSWPSGGEVWDTDIAANHSSKSKNFHYLVEKSQAHYHQPLIQPRTGVAHTSDEINILTYLRKHGLDVASIQLDAASRKKMYDKAREGVNRSEQGSNSFLNGYPVPVHGVKGIKAILEAIDTPFQIRGGSPDHRLVYEIALAGGATSVEGGFICYLYPYDKYTSPLESLKFWKYVDKLVDWYDKNYQIVINREFFGPLTCCLLEPSIPICINIIQAILSAKAGVKCISVGLAEQGNRSQDIAAFNVLDQLTHAYLTKYHIHNCRISTVYHQYMAAFPRDISKARNLIIQSAATGYLANTHRMLIKTPVEAFHIPSKEHNAEAIKLSIQGIHSAMNNGKLNQTAIHQEMRLLGRQVHAIMKRIENLGNGSIARGAIRAFEEGILDIPFSPSNFNRNRLITARDCHGAIRFVNPERLPFENDICDFHKEKIHQRVVKEKITKISAILEKDLTRIWKNDYPGWPLDNRYVT
jgi:methylaspartate mutase epsilon subunit